MLGDIYWTFDLSALFSMFVSSLIFCCYSSFRMPIDACVHVCRGASQTTDCEWGTKWNETPNTAASMGSFIRKTTTLCSRVLCALRERSEESQLKRERESALRCINKRNALFTSVVSPYSLCSVCCCYCCLSLCQRRCRRLSGCIFAAAALRLQVVMTTTRRRQQQQNRKAKAASGRQKKESNTVYSGA